MHRHRIDRWLDFTWFGEFFYSLNGWAHLRVARQRHESGGV